MSNKLQHITKNKKAGNHKKKVKEHIDAVYHMSEMVDAIQRYYNFAYPNSPKLSRDRIRAIILFFLDTIIYSVDRGARISIAGFGSFRKTYVKEAYYPENINRSITYRPPFNRVSFKPSSRFNDIINNRRNDAFGENQLILDDINDFDNPPPEKKDRFDKLKEKVLNRFPEIEKELE